MSQVQGTLLKYLRGFVVIAILFGQSLASAHRDPFYPSYPYFYPVAPAPRPSTLTTGDQYFELSLRGLDRYLQSLEATDPAAANALRPKLDEMIANQRRATRISLIAGGVGLALSIGSFTFLAKEETDIGGIETTDVNDAALAGGIALMLGGAVASWLLAPQRGDLMDFVNEHNRVRSNNPLKLEVGGYVTPSSAVGTLAVSF